MSFNKNSEGNRRARTSAAMIGLAISVGASGLLLPGQSDEAKAADPVKPDPAAAALPDASNNAAIQENQEATASSTSKLEQTLLQGSKNDGKETAIATSNKDKLQVTLPIAPQAIPTSLPSVLPAKATAVTASTIGQLPSMAMPVASSAVISPKAMPMPNPIIESAKTQVGMATAAQSPVQGEVHQVKPGDTLDEIAQAYGVSRADLVVVIPAKTANLPGTTASQGHSALTPAASKVLTTAAVNQVKPEQPLNAIAPTHGLSQKPKSSPTQPVSVLPNLNTASSSSASKFSSQRFSPNLAAPSLPNSTAMLGGTRESGLSAKPAPSIFQQSTASNSKTSATGQVGQSYDFKAELPSGNYIDKLKNEIAQMRQQYQTQKEGTLANQGANTFSETLPVPAVLNSGSGLSQYPSPSRYNQAFQGGTQGRFQKQAAEPTAIEIKVPAPAVSGKKQSILAFASVGAENYNPLTQPQIGQPVSPETTIPGLKPQQQGPAAFNGFAWPAQGVLTSGYGPRWGRMHKGIDIAAPVGTPIKAAAPGVVISAGWNAGGYGNLVEIQHADGSTTRYGHNSKILVHQGETVKQGQQIAEMGSTGRSTGPHCHFEVHPKGQGAVNPIAFLPKR